jgi:hypothetical protein
MKYARLCATLIAVSMLGGCAASDDDLEEDDVAEASQAATKAVYRKEAEAETWAGGYKTAVGTGNGSTGGYLAMYYPGGPQAAFIVPKKGKYRIAARVSGTACNGLPTAAFFIDGEPAGDVDVPVEQRANGSLRWFTKRSGFKELTKGAHSYGIKLTNDKDKGACDRNIFVDYVIVEKQG